MNKYPLIGGSICAVALLVLGSFTNIVVTKSVQGSSCCGIRDDPHLSGWMGDNNWYRSPVVVTFNDSVHSIDYRIDGGNWTNYTKPFTLSTEGIHLLEWTCDSNMSNIFSIKIKIDRIKPLITLFKVKRVGFLEWQITINATDNISGVNRVWCGMTNSIDTEPPYQFMWHGCLWLYQLLTWFEITMPYNAWDNAGNHLDYPS